VNNFKKIKLALVTAAVLGVSPPVSAVVVVGGDNGWEVSFDGNINQFYVYSDLEGRPDSVIGGNLVSDFDVAPGASESSSRFRTGLLPALFSFNVKAPTWNNLDMGARVSFAGQTQNPNTKNRTFGHPHLPGGSGFGLIDSSDTSGLGGNLEFREAFFTIDGVFGQILLGRTLSLFMGKNILTDQTLFGVGAPGNVSGGGFALGRIGFGYLYPNFNSQIRWTSPVMRGFIVSLAGVDPSQVCGEGGVFVAGDRCHTKTDAPRFEGEVSFANTFNNGSYQLWLSGMYQNAELKGPLVDPALGFADVGNQARVWGATAGTQMNLAGFELTGSYYHGQGLGTTFLLDADSLDATGQARNNQGWLVQGGYTFWGQTKFAASWGKSRARETANDQNCRTGIGNCVGFEGARLDEQTAYVVGVYHDINANLKLVAEYSRIENEWHDGQEQKADVVGVGGFFFW
jgi:hypothetical protein